MTFRDPKTEQDRTAKFLSTYANGKAELHALRDPKVAAELAAALAGAGLLHPGGYVSEVRAFGVLVEDGHAVQHVAPGDPNWNLARNYVRQSVECPWTPEVTAKGTSSRNV